MADYATAPQPPPLPGKQVVVAAVIEDLLARAEKGRTTYGTLLMTDNDRDALIDAYQEAMDLVFYLRQFLLERAANASLFAAAPDLLAACETLLAWYAEGMPTAADIAMTAGFQKANAAVAKARGPLTKGGDSVVTCPTCGERLLRL